MDIRKKEIKGIIYELLVTTLYIAILMVAAIIIMR